MGLLRLAQRFWGTGVFREGADLMLDFAFETVGGTASRRARPCQNGRGNGALRKIGAVRKRFCGSRSCGTASSSIRCCARFSKTNERAMTRPPIVAAVPQWVH